MTRSSVPAAVRDDPAAPSDTQRRKHALPPQIAMKVEMLSTASLIPYAGHARTHSKKQIMQLAASIRQFGFNDPVAIAEDGVIIAGHGRIAAALHLGLEQVPVLRLIHLTAAEQRAYRLAANRLAEHSGWDDALMALELQALNALDLDFDLELLGWDGAELNAILDYSQAPEPDEADEVPLVDGPPITRAGDVWIMGEHRLICGDARHDNHYKALLLGEAARMVFADPPYNVPVDGHVGGLGKIHHRPFVMASGEMSAEEFQRFLAEVLAAMARVSIDGAIHFICMDWRGLQPLLCAAATYAEFKNLIVWAKTNAGMGSFYRSQHELIGVFKIGKAAHINNFGLGDTGRYRTNLWTYPGGNSFGQGRDEALAMHPTVKPVAMVADAIKDVSRPGDIVLDPFGGSGTTLIAAAKTRRRARLMELDPIFCDTICRRWEAFSGLPAVLEGTGQAFAHVAHSRLAEGDVDGR